MASKARSAASRSCPAGNCYPPGHLASSVLQRHLLRKTASPLIRVATYYYANYGSYDDAGLRFGDGPCLAGVLAWAWLAGATHRLLEPAKPPFALRLVGGGPADEMAEQRKHGLPGLLPIPPKVFWQTGKHWLDGWGKVSVPANKGIGIRPLF